MMRPQIRDTPRKTSAFSLVEVTIAIGIVAFALLAVLGLVPVGMDTLAEASRRTAQADIARSTLGEIKSTPFSELDDFVAGFPVHYDDQGVRVDSAHAVYTVRVSLDAARLDGRLRSGRVLIGFQTNPDPTKWPQARVERIAFLLSDTGI